MRLPRAVLPLAALLVLPAGCRPRPHNPLDWVIDARSPSHLEDWIGTAKKQMAPDLDRDFEHALNQIGKIIPLYKGYDLTRYEAADDPLCQRVNGKTVREVIEDGFDADNTTLRLELNRDLDNRVRNVASRELLGDGQDQVKTLLDWNLERENAEITRDEALIKQNEARISALNRPGS